MTAAEMNSMILENIGDQLKEQVDDSIKAKLSSIYKNWLRELIKAEAPVLSGQVTKAQQEAEAAAGEEMTTTNKEATNEEAVE